jgi:hypothetical protein
LGNVLQLSRIVGEEIVLENYLAPEVPDAVDYSKRKAHSKRKSATGSGPSDCERHVHKKSRTAPKAIRLFSFSKKR